MTTAFAHFAAAAHALAPRTAVVLGSGLAGATAAFTELHGIPFDQIPGLVPPTVSGHRSRLALGTWDGVPVLLFGGRLHHYEGHPWDVVTGPVRVAAELGVTRLVLTNAAGGIHPSLGPGSLMAIRGHVKLLGPVAWREVAAERGVCSPYSGRLTDVMTQTDPDLVRGVYGALTGPCYETPAEIRALRVIGADAVGMSTAVEAEAAIGLGMEVAAVSCITNKAAGLGGQTLAHHEVLENANLAVARLGDLLTAAIQFP